MPATGEKVVGRGTPGWQAAVARASPVSSDSSLAAVSHLSLCRRHVLSIYQSFAAVLGPFFLAQSSPIYPNKVAPRSSSAILRTLPAHGQVLPLHRGMNYFTADRRVCH